MTYHEITEHHLVTLRNVLAHMEATPPLALLHLAEGLRAAIAYAERQYYISADKGFGENGSRLGSAAG